MALSAKTVNKHNLKRAEVFAEHGLGTHDIHLAHPNFEGPSAGGDQDCILCDHKHIVWQFSIKFDVPDVTTALGKVATGLVRTEEAVLKYVGSKCITDWLDAVPESTKGLDELRERWKKELKKCEAAKKLLAAEKYCENAGFVSTDEMTAREVAYQAFLLLDYSDKQTLTWKEQKSLSRNGYKVRYGTCSPSTTKRWLEMIVTCGGLSKLGQIEPILQGAPKPALATPAPVTITMIEDDENPLPEGVMDYLANASDSEPTPVSQVEETTMTIDLNLLKSPKYANLTGLEIYTLISTLGVTAPPAPAFDPDKVMPTQGATVQEAAEQQTQSDPEPEPEKDSLIEKADEVFDTGAHENLGAKAREAFLDIRSKVKKYGSFVSNSQRGYFAKLIGWANQPKKVTASPSSNGTVKPGDKSFASASGINGARY